MVKCDRPPTYFHYMAPAQTPPAKYYFGSIDGLRLIASINIVLFHLERMGGLNDLHGAPAWLFCLIKGPAFHASLFFILGGFIYTAKYASSANTFSARKFLGKRISTLVPLHVLMVLAMVPLIVIQALNSGGIPYGKLFASLFMHLSLLWSFFPLGTYSLNTPSWALSAFFLCFVLFGPLLKFVTGIASRRAVVLIITAAFSVIIVWSIGYAKYSVEGLYIFFHVFAPIRLFEFLVGMLLARLYHLNNTKPRKLKVQDIPLCNDLLIVLTVAAIYLNVRYIGAQGSNIQYFSYHVLMPPLYAILVYRIARGNGLIARFFALPFVRQVGVCSFYPYLVHVPLAAWVGWVCQDIFGYARFFHSPVNVALFLVCLYGASAWIWRSRKGKLPAKTTIPKPV